MLAVARGALLLVPRTHAAQAPEQRRAKPVRSDGERTKPKAEPGKSKPVAVVTAELKGKAASWCAGQCARTRLKRMQCRRVPMKKSGPGVLLQLQLLLSRQFRLAGIRARKEKRRQPSPSPHKYACTASRRRGCLNDAVDARPADAELPGNFGCSHAALEQRQGFVRLGHRGRRTALVFAFRLRLGDAFALAFQA